MKICWAQYLLWLVIAVLGAGSALTACGQKGALYHPSSAEAQKVPAASLMKSEPSMKSESSAHHMPAAQSESSP
ncbi:MAG: lipoprotein [Gammaproteobacteria bacterium]